MKLDRKQYLNVLYQVCVFRVDRKKQDGYPGLWLAETFSTSPLKPLYGIHRKLTRNKISISFSNFVFLGPIGSPRWASGSDWLRHFRLFLVKSLNEIQRKLTGSKILTSSTKFVFFGPIPKTRWLPWLRHFRLLLWNSRIELNETWQEARYQRPLQNLCFWVRSENKMAAPASNWLKNCQILWKCCMEFNESWQEARSQRPLQCFSGRSQKQDGRCGLWLVEAFMPSPLIPLNRIQRKLTGSKISKSSLKFVFRVRSEN